MRVSITGDAEFVGLLADMDTAPITIESVADETDRMEQPFGLVEAVTIIAAVKGVVELSNAVIKLWENRRSNKKQVLRLKSSSGTTTIELAPDATEEDVRRAVSPLFAE